MRKLKRIINSILIALLLTCVVATPVLAAPVAIVEFNTGQDDQDWAPRDGYYVAQTFTAPTDFIITSIKCKVAKQATGAFNVEVSLRAVDGGTHKPTGSNLSALGTTVGATLPAYDGTNGEWRDFDIGDYSCTNGTEYAILLTTSEVDQYARWDRDAGGGYANGQPWTSTDDGGTWGAHAGDRLFEIWGNPSPTVTTQAVTNIGDTTATGNGNITVTYENCSAWGVCYNTTGNPDTGDDTEGGSGSGGTGAFTASMTGLTPDEHYYVKAYATNSAGTSYGSVVEFDTTGPPSVTTSAATNVEETTATLNANLTDLGTYSPVYAFFQYGLTGGYGTNTSEQEKTGTGTYNQAIADLSPGTTYHFRAAVKYDSSYVYGSDATLNTKPYVPSSVSATTGMTSVTLNWTKGSGADTTVIRRSTTAFPTTPASGDSVYDGSNNTVTDDTLITEQIYYYSLWSKANGVHSDSYITISATPSADVLSPPDELDIIDVKVFSSYSEHMDNLYVIRYKIIYNAGDPTQDCADFFNFELLDGSTLIAQVPVEMWGYRPGSIYLGTLSTPTWGGSYTIKLIGNNIAWGTPPVTQWNLTSGDWVGADLTQLDTWVISSAEAFQTYYDIQYVIYAPTGAVLSDEGGMRFNMGITNLSIERPHLFRTTAEWMGAEPTEHIIDPEGAMTTDNMGDYIKGILQSGADLVSIPLETFGGLLFGGGYAITAIAIGVAMGSIVAGLGIASPILILGMVFGVISPSVPMVIAIVLVLIIFKSFWLRGQ